MAGRVDLERGVGWRLGALGWTLVSLVLDSGNSENSCVLGSWCLLGKRGFQLSGFPSVVLSVSSHLCPIQFYHREKKKKGTFYQIMRRVDREQLRPEARAFSAQYSGNHGSFCIELADLRPAVRNSSLASGVSQEFGIKRAGTQVTFLFEGPCILHWRPVGIAEDLGGGEGVHETITGKV